jgi:hypothetical protein
MSAMLGTTTSWANELIENYRQGFSDAEVAAALNITIREFHTQLADNASFAKLVEFGRTLSAAFWESLARKNVGNKAFNSSLYSFYMKNKFGWADKVETTSVGENTNINLDELRQQIYQKVGQLVKQNHPELADAQRVLQPVLVKELSE